MQRLLQQALANPWAALEHVYDGPLHPGGIESTTALLDRAAVGRGTRVLDAGCGPGYGVSLASDRGAETIGLDLDPPNGGVRGDITTLPLRAESVDVVLAECVLCLVPERTHAFKEFRRVLRPDGRIALSDVTVEGDPPDLPAAISEAFCLSNAMSRDRLIAAIEHAGFAVGEVRDHREELLTMRDRLRARVDYEALFGMLGEPGEEWSSAIENLEAAVESGRIGYVSIIGRLSG